MDCKICLILIGIITLSNGRPAKDEPSVLVANENELQQLLKTLYSNGKFDIAFSHHEDGPETHHEDQARISPHDDHLHKSRHHHDKARYSHDEATHQHVHHGSHEHTTIEKHPSLTNIQTLNLIYRKKPSNPSDNNYDEGVESLLGLKNKNSEKNVNKVVQILDLLKDVDKNVGTVAKLGRTNDNRDDDDDDCRGGCGGRNDEYNNDRNNNNDRFCIGDRCGHDDRDDADNVLRCFGDRCGRADDNDDKAACVGDRCGRGRDDDDDDDDADYKQTVLRDRRLPEADSFVEQQIRSNAHRYKISDELDAIVVDMSGLQNSLANANDHSDKEPLSNVRLIENVNFGNLLETRNDDSEESVRDQNVLDLDSNPIKAVVVDLSKSQNDLTSQLQELLNNRQVKSNRVRVSNNENLPLEGESKILSHNEDNNNVYVPKWLLEEVIAKTNLRGPEQILKTLMPMTAKQKEKLVNAIAVKNSNASKRIFRRSVEDDIGVPFHLQVQGLGQVNP